MLRAWVQAHTVTLGSFAAAEETGWRVKICLGSREKRVGKWLGPLKQHHENCSHSRYFAINYRLFTLPSSKHLTLASNPPSILFSTSSLFPNSFSSFYYTCLKTWAFIEWFKRLEEFKVFPKHKRMRAFVVQEGGTGGRISTWFSISDLLPFLFIE